MFHVNMFIDKIRGHSLCIFHAHNILLWPSGDSFSFVQCTGREMSDNKGSIDDGEESEAAAVENRAASSVLKDELLYQQRLLRFQTTILSLQCLILLILGDTGEISPPHLKVAIWVDVKHRSLRMQAHVQL